MELCSINSMMNPFQRKFKGKLKVDLMLEWIPCIMLRVSLGNLSVTINLSTFLRVELMSAVLEHMLD